MERLGTWPPLLDHLPVRVLPNDFIVSKLVVIASADSDRHSIASGASKQPFRKDHVSTDPMSVIAVVNVGKTVEACRQPLSNRRFAYEALSPGFRASWKIKGTIISEEPHNGIQIMPVECFKDLL